MKARRTMTRLFSALLCMGLIVGLPGLHATHAEAPEKQAGQARANLIFIHHSVGGDWLHRGLQQALNDNGYHVADTNYGWCDYGDLTDTGHWPMWFSDEVMPLVYAERGNSIMENVLAPAPGDNSIVMFKSCFPNSDVGNSIADEQEIYRSLLPYFSAHPDKLFVLVTPPPMTSLPTPQLTRELASWLANRETGWLKDYEGVNAYAFDFYNVLTAPDAHHRMLDGQESHEVVPGHDTLFYDSNGDNHPNEQGDRKAAEEFVPLLNAWYERFLGGQ